MILRIIKAIHCLSQDGASANDRVLMVLCRDDLHRIRLDGGVSLGIPPVANGWAGRFLGMDMVVVENARSAVMTLGPDGRFVYLDEVEP